MKQIIPWISILIIATFLLTFKFLKVPPGIETDEGAIAYNAALISKTLHDQNGRFLPFFILSSDKIDWKQPVTIYSSAILFKLFGTSLSVFKLVNVFTALASLLMMSLVLRELFTEKLALIGSIIFITTPIFIIASRIGTEAITPLFFATSWLLSIVYFQKQKKSLFLVTTALSLGIGFYSYKGMRLIVPPWTILTGIYLYLSDTRKARTNLTTFLITLLPFFLITPVLENKYAGAVFDRRQFTLESYRHYIYYWFSNLEPSLIFVRGDMGRIFSVEKFGTFSLGALPFFLIGIKKVTEKNNFYTFVLIAFLITPIFFGLSGAMGDGHRLVAMMPAYIIITTLGAGVLFEKSTFKNITSRIIFTSLIIFFLAHTTNFIRYYFFVYPNLRETREAFQNTFNEAFYKLSQISSNNHLTPYIQDDVYYSHGEGIKFFETAYFKNPLLIWKPGQNLPPKSILLTQIKQIENLKTIEADISPLYILENEKTISPDSIRN